MFLLVAHFRSADTSADAPPPATDHLATDHPATAGPATDHPATAGPATAGPATAGPATAGPATAGPATAGPATDGPATDGPAIDEDDRAAVALLAAQPTTRWVRWAGSTEEAGHRVLVAEFASAADYRRALSPFDVRMTVVPWLSGAQVSTSGVFEVHAAAGADAAGVGAPGAASGPLLLSQVTVTDPGR